MRCSQRSKGKRRGWLRPGSRLAGTEREHEHDLLQASSLVLVTSSRGQEMIVMVAKPSVATVPINTDHPARVFGEKRYLEKSKNLIFTQWINFY